MKKKKKYLYVFVTKERREEAKNVLKRNGVKGCKLIEEEPKEGYPEVQLLAPEGDFDGVGGIQKYINWVKS